MDLPADLEALVEDLTLRGFKVQSNERHEWPGGPVIVLASQRGEGVDAVRLTQEHGLWDVMVRIENGWYEPFLAQRALTGEPHEQRALSHAERRQATLGLLDRFTGERAQVDAISARQRELTEAYTRSVSAKPEPDCST